MIEVQKSIHDNFTVEFKVGYNVDSDTDINNFSVRTWIFMPSSLSISRKSYPSELFYRDLKVHTRLITPIFSLQDIASSESVPISNLREACKLLSQSSEPYSKTSYEYHIKMFIAIVRSSVRDTTYCITKAKGYEEIFSMINDYVSNISKIKENYRDLYAIIDSPIVSQELINIYRFGDEYLSNLTDYYTFKIINRLKTETTVALAEIHSKLTELLRYERAYKVEKEYVILNKDSAMNNREYVYHMNVLKRFIDSDLFLDTKKKQDAVIMQQILYSLAAGISMVFATAIAFSFQRKFGNFTMPLFVALVVSYMLKDRIKDLMRYYFANKQKSRYYDNKTTISVGDTYLGWSRESFDFIPEEKIPSEVIDIRNRTPILSAENRYNGEQIMLYRKMVRLKKSVLEDSDTYTTNGINEIIRFNLSYLVQKMDNSKVTYNTINEEGDIDRIKADKIYYINYILHLEYNNQNEYKRYRIVCSRDGIIDIEEPMKKR